MLFAVSNNNTGFGSSSPGISAYGRSFWIQFRRPNSPNEWQVQLYGSSGASVNASSSYIYLYPYSYTYYGRFSRIGSTAYLSLYTDSGYTNQYLYTLSVTSSSASFRYLYGLSSMNEGGVIRISRDGLEISVAITRPTPISTGPLLCLKWETT